MAKYIFPAARYARNGPLCTYFVLHELSVSMEASGASTQKGFSKFLVGSVVKPLCNANLFIKFSQKLCTLKHRIGLMIFVKINFY